MNKKNWKLYAKDLELENEELNDKLNGQENLIRSLWKRDKALEVIILKNELEEAQEEIRRCYKQIEANSKRINNEL